MVGSGPVAFWQFQLWKALAIKGCRFSYGQMILMKLMTFELEVKSQASTPWLSDTSLKIQSPSPKSKHSQSCRNDRKLVITCELWSAKCAKCDAVSPVSLEMSSLLTSPFAHQISQEWVEMGENKRYLQSSGKFLLLKMQPSKTKQEWQSLRQCHLLEVCQEIFKFEQ